MTPIDTLSPAERAKLARRWRRQIALHERWPSWLRFGDQDEEEARIDTLRALLAELDQEDQASSVPTMDQEADADA